ncbi:MAG: PfkB family carbohydrate kinase [Chthoniobacterales bacterium]|nr:PfkB family carbohydrate kinase [Chthoniobacterales bacterium]
MAVLVVGSIALDDIETPYESRKNLLGGSASYASLAASFYSPVNLVGIVGSDFPNSHLEFFKKHRINLNGLQIIAGGKTFRWSGKYHADWNTRETLSVCLNVFENFTPQLPPEYLHPKVTLLANIAPTLQNHVLDQLTHPQFTIADTMDLWINTQRAELEKLLQRIDLLILNDSEARLFTSQANLLVAARQILKFGPAFVIVKKGEHGAMLVSETELFLAPAYPVEQVSDPTGAGDTFAGGVAGWLAANLSLSPPTFNQLRYAILRATALASFCVEDFSLEGLRNLTTETIESRVSALHSFISCP